MTTPGGLVIVDKPGGWTSHDVVAKIRKLAGTKRVGHAGTLDPMATGVLVVGVGQATRLLGYLALTEKEYTATIRLGQATDSDDADGEVIGHVPVLNIGEAELLPAIATLTGAISQVPPGVSAIKVGGQRAYKLARAGEAPELAARTVTVTEFAVDAIRHAGDLLDVDCARDVLERHLHQGAGSRPGRGARRRRAPDGTAPHARRSVPDERRPHTRRTGAGRRGTAAGSGRCGGVPAPRPD